MKNKGHFQTLNRQFFTVHQRKLLWLLNAPLIKYWFRWVLRIHKDLKWNEKICEIQPNNYKVYLGMYLIKVKGKLEYKIRADFSTHNKFSKRLYFAFKPIWWTMHFIDWVLLDRYLPQYSFSFATLTVYPDPDPETTSVDGTIYRNIGNPGETFSSIRDGAGNGGGDATADYVCAALFSSDTSNQYQYIMRAPFLFDTSSLTANASISAATLSLYGTATYNANWFTSSIGLTSCSPASNTALVVADYNIANWGSTEFATRITFASWSTSTYNDFSLNASGLSNISKTGISKFGSRISHDIDNSAPTWINLAVSYVSCYFADQTGTTNDPKLVITYTISTDKMFLMFD